MPKKHLHISRTTSRPKINDQRDYRSDLVYYRRMTYYPLIIIRDENYDPVLPIINIRTDISAHRISDSGSVFVEQTSWQENIPNGSTTSQCDTKIGA